MSKMLQGTPLELPKSQYLNLKMPEGEPLWLPDASAQKNAEPNHT